MTTQQETDAALDRRAREIEDVVAKTMRAMADMVVEDKRLVVEQIDRLVSAEEATHEVIQ